jgi:type IV fimbrial biogenesis protein FimT
MKRQTGFTLTELITTMAIVGILIGIGVPSYRYVTTANRMSSEINGLLGDLQFARSEAVREGVPVIVCPTTDGVSCAPATTVWNTGWLVYSDLNGNGAVDAPDEVLRTQTGLSANDTLNATAATQFSFNREGFAVGVAAGEVLTLHDPTNNTTYTRCLDVSLMGMAAVVTHAKDATCT